MRFGQPLWVRVVLRGLVVLALSTRLDAARLFLDTRPTTADPSDQYCDILLREIPRQMILITAMDDLGIDAIDPTIEIGAVPAEGDIKLGLERKQSRQLHLLHVDLFDGDKKLIDSSDVVHAYMFHGLPRMRDLVTKMDQQNHARWREILSKRLSSTPVKENWSENLAPPAQVAKYLETIDFQNAFLAARLTHQAIKQSGESPQRLGALVRAYTHLAESTRDLVSGHSAAFWARAYVYAVRLAQRAPNDPASWWHLGYLQTMHGMTLDALDDFKRADELAPKQAAPTWVVLVRQMLEHQSSSLFENVQQNDPPLASYFAWRTVEHSCLATLTIDFAKLALDKNPGSLRAYNSMIWNSSYSNLDSYAAGSTDVLNRLFRSLGACEDAPSEVSAAAKRAAAEEFKIPAMVAMLQSIHDADRKDDPHLPWAVYTSIVREEHFVQAATDPFYSDFNSFDATARMRTWWPLVKDHRYAALVASYDRAQRLNGDAMKNLRAVQFYDLTQVFNAAPIGHYLVNNGILDANPHHTNWANFVIMQNDKSAYEAAMTLWQYRFTTGPAYVEDRINIIDLMDDVSPDHPVALEWRALEDWQKLAPRVAEIEKKMPDNPIVYYALGIEYARLKQYDHATDLLIKASRYARDMPVYKELAEIRLAQNDVDGYLQQWTRFFKESEDTGQDHAEANRQISIRLMGNGQFEKAVPYARRSLELGVGGAREAYLLALTRSGSYAEAEQLLARGYLITGSHYRWCRETGRGDLEAARRQIASYSAAVPIRSAPAVLLDAAMFYLAEGETDRAIQLLTPASATDQAGATALILAMIKMENKEIDQAKTLLQNRMKQPQVDVKTRAYISVAGQLLRCIDDPTALPFVDEDISSLEPVANAPTLGNVYYLFGRLCEFRGKNDEARQWYRKSLDALSPTFTFRFTAAIALRKLGEEYYK